MFLFKGKKKKIRVFKRLSILNLGEEIEERVYYMEDLILLLIYFDWGMYSRS